MVTSLKDLQKYAEGSEEKLPDFAQGQPFVARLRRVSLMSLVKEGKIPNKLYSAVISMFGLGEKKEKVTVDMLKENTDVMEIVVKDSLVEPAYEQLKEIGLRLTEDQILAIYNFSQSGVNELESFRAEQSDNVSVEHGEGVQQAAE